MLTTIRLESQTVDALAAKARLRGLSLEAFLRLVAQGEQATDPPVGGGNDGARDAAEFDRTLDELFTSEATRPPSPDLTYARDEIYCDHD